MVTPFPPPAAAPSQETDIERGYRPPEDAHSAPGPRPSAAMSRRFVLSGAAAGMISTVAFTWLHQLTISNIWFAILPMLVAGALCGACLAWSYGVLFPRRSPASWFLYNVMYVGFFIMLGMLSMVMYEPITSVGEILAGGRPASELFAAAMPLTIAFTIGTALVVSAIWGRTLPQFAVVLLTCVVLVGFLGMNISILGLVRMTSEGWMLMAQFFGLVFALAIAFAVAQLVLERRALAWSPGRRASPLIS
jgi:hypothetical protein